MHMQYKQMTAYHVRRVAESLLRLAEDLFARHLGIRVQEWRVLAKLADATESIATEIGRDMLLTPVQTGRSLLKLHELGMVNAMPDPGDRRATRYTLTPVGLQCFEAGTRIILRVQERALHDLSAVERVALDSLLARVMQNSEYDHVDVEHLSIELFDKSFDRASTSAQGKGF